MEHIFNSLSSASQDSKIHKLCLHHLLKREREIRLGGHCFCTSPSYYWVETIDIEERGRGLERERGWKKKVSVE